MKRKKTLILLLVLLALLIAAVFVVKAVTKHVDKINTTDEIVFTSDPEKVTSIRWTKGSDGLEFVNEKGTWKAADDATFPVSQDAIADVLSHFEEVHASFVIDDVDDYSQYGLSRPECIVTLKTSDGESVVKMGAYSQMDAKRYVDVGDGKVYLVDDDLAECVDTDRDSYLQNDRSPAFSEIEKIVTSGSSTLNIEYDPDNSYVYNDNYSYYQVANGKHLPLSDSRVQTLIERLMQYAPADYASYNATKETLGEYGLDRPEISFTLSGKDADENEQSYTLHVSSVETEEKDDDGNPVKNVYCRFNDSSVVYNMDQSYYEYFTDISYDTLRPPEALNINWDELKSISVTIGGKSYLIEPLAAEDGKEGEKAVDENGNVRYGINGTEVDIKDIKAALDKIAVNTFNSEKPSKPVEVEVTVNLENEEYSSFTLKAYQYDGTDCLATLNGQTLGLVSRGLVVTLTEAVNQVVLGLD